MYDGIWPDIPATYLDMFFPFFSLDTKYTNKSLLLKNKIKQKTLVILVIVITLVLYSDALSS